MLLSFQNTHSSMEDSKQGESVAVPKAPRYKECQTKKGIDPERLPHIIESTNQLLSQKNSNFQLSKANDHSHLLNHNVNALDEKGKSYFFDSLLMSPKQIESKYRKMTSTKYKFMEKSKLYDFSKKI